MNVLWHWLYILDGKVKMSSNSKEKQYIISFPLNLIKYGVNFLIGIFNLKFLYRFYQKNSYNTNVDFVIFNDFHNYNFFLQKTIFGKTWHDKSALNKMLFMLLNFKQKWSCTYI